MAKENILVVDDEADILKLVKYNFEKDGYKCECVTTGEEAIKSAIYNQPDIIVLDLMLPGVDGLEVCRQLKSNSKTSHIPIIMLTAKSEDIDVVSGLELGADDYVTKPFSPRVLLARVRAILRRGKRKIESDNEIVEINELTINPIRREVGISGNIVDLTVTEFNILYFLARHPGWVFTRSQIINAIKGEDYEVTERSVDVQIVSLRKKLDSIGERIETVRGIGYRFKE
jgi:two-component system, OmpR family, alkaline phosphatase synthesis response regulator PhoP